jgi:ATP-binding cassette, subfamily B, bacterial PglK
LAKNGEACQAMDGRSSQSVIASLRFLYRGLSTQRRRHLSLVLVLMLASAIAELATIGALLPFLSLIADPARGMRIGWIASLFGMLGAHSPHDVIVVSVILFGFVTLAAAGVRLLFAWWSQAFVFRLGHEVGVELQWRILHQPYTYHVMTNSSEFVSALEKVQNLVFNILAPLIQAIGAAVISLFIVGVLVAIDPAVALSSAAAFALLYIAVTRLFQRRIDYHSAIVNRAYTERVQAVQESTGSIRDILIDRAQREYTDYFADIDARLRSSQTITSFIGAAPRFIIEAFGMLLIVGMALLLSMRSGGLSAAIPTLGAMALGAQRLLPLLQQVYFGWVQVAGFRHVLADVTEMLALPLGDDDGPSEAVPLKRQVTLNDVAYTYPGRDVPVLSDINLTITKGTRVALVGATGSGKSTLVDLIMGLLAPTSGAILVDGDPLTGARLRGWQATIAHVPQAIFLSDSSILRNIAFGIPAKSIDRARVEAAARRAQLHEFVAQLPEGYDTEVGERGVRLSGGQRQRLGIARALYKEASVLVLDEATSALDDATEAAVIQSLESLDERLTIIMIAHRLSTIANCDLVVRLSEGRIVEAGTYAGVVKNLQLENN